MKDLTQHKRPIAETLDEIASYQAQHAMTADAFHRAFYESRQTHGMTYYQGIPILKNPMDLWVLHEVIWDLQPTLIIETGTACGGSALYMAHQLDQVGVGQVVTIDLDPAESLPKHERVTYLSGFSSVDPVVVKAVSAAASIHPRVMVVLDSDHSKEHVLAELAAYAPLVTTSQFLIVEDTNLNGRPVQLDWRGGPGPGPAVDEWLPQHPDFVREILAERYMMTFHTWLRRKSNGE